jgi:hypothetical protein
MATSESQHILDLSRELLDDIELGKLDADKLLLKCSRLARLAGTQEAQSWIHFEMIGYHSGDQIALKYMGLTGRWTNQEQLQGYWGPLAQQEATIEAQKAKLSSLRLPDIGGDWANLAVTNAIKTINETSAYISTFSAIRSRVLGLLHGFVSEVYYSRVFAGIADDTFEVFKRETDALIASSAGDVLQKIPSVVTRLREDDVEAVSQALTTCRRILEAFADAIFPPTDATIKLGGNILKLDASKHQNRINAYISERSKSTSRRQRLRQNLANLFDRVSSGVHHDVDTKEAFALFLNVYLFLGEVLQLGKSDVSKEIEVE